MLKPIILFIIKFQIFIPALIIIIVNGVEIYLKNIVKLIFNEMPEYIISTSIQLLLIILFILIIKGLILFLLKIVKSQDLDETVSFTNISHVSNDMFVDVYAFMLLAIEAINIELDKILSKFPFYLLVIYLFIKIINNSCYPNYIFKIIGFNVYKLYTINGLEKILISKTKYTNDNVEKTNINVIELDEYTLIEL
ncbi:unclassified [Brachyspira pilosicoli WesB]|uniref:Unclassified n=1 Tax=Brachyspira pilosicoli WesB TaxID=1161918 RepID=K0JM22_BRAPL|nr:hypothetical protein [Brachyspira pilosicoli]CCG57321.1 unclassified [Brachyspira pilosicoli WesB]